jgi:prepilin-type processing-associated H-X9-DG protein
MPRIFWIDLLKPYGGHRRLQECPSWPKSGKYLSGEGNLVRGDAGIGINYGALFSYPIFNGVPYRVPTSLAQVADPAGTLMLADGQGGLHVYSPVVRPMTLDWDRDGIPDSEPGVFRREGPYNRTDPFRHRGGANCAFVDGHARWIDAKTLITNKNDIWGSTLSRR